MSCCLTFYLYSFLCFNFTKVRMLFQPSTDGRYHSPNKKNMSKGIAVVLCEDQHEVLEFWYPRLRLEEAGYEVKVVGPKIKEKYTSKEGYWAFTDTLFSEIDPKEVFLVLIFPDC